LKRAEVIRLSTELECLLDQRRELERRACDRLADSILTLAARGSLHVQRPSVVNEGSLAHDE
jgi:hypothetical protein